MYGDDILSVVFLALICIVVSSVIIKIAPYNSNLIVPSCAFISVVLWVAYDYILLIRYRDRDREMKRNMTNGGDEAIVLQEINNLSIDNVLVPEKNSNDESSDTPGGDPSNKHLNNSGITIPNTSLANTYNKIKYIAKKNLGEFDIDLYNHNSDIRNIHGEMGVPGDTQLCNRMKYMGLQPQLSKNFRAAWNARKLQPYVEAELREEEDINWISGKEDILYAGMI